MHFKTRVDDVKRGILLAGGFPMELPALSLSESFLKPTTMLYRNLLAMDAEELLRGHPVDGVVLMGGCDKDHAGAAHGCDQRRLAGNLSTRRADAARQTEGQGAGFRLRRLEVLGRAPRRHHHRRRLGQRRSRHRPAVTATCMTMGTPRPWTAIAESIGIDLAGASSIPAADAGHIRMASESGRRIVKMVWEDLTPQKKIQSRKAFEKRHYGSDGDGLLDQCDHPSDRAGAPRRPGHRA